MPIPRKRREAPPLSLFLTEPGRAGAEIGLFLATRPLRPTLPVGDGQPVLFLPGLLADDHTFLPMRRTLRTLGYRTHGWRLGRNIGPTFTAVRGMENRIDELADRYGRPVSVVGWSLGGVYARALARRRPEHVRQVITLGSPIRMQHRGQTRATSTFERFAHLHVEQPGYPLEQDDPPLVAPATSIYSRCDGIVSWKACLDLPAPNAENIAIYCSHLGFGHHPAAIWAVADRLAQPEDAWTPFRAPTVLRPLYPRPDQPAVPATADEAKAA
jgi:pimeloyl-ACP methyl ester carboxylesterase